MTEYTKWNLAEELFAGFLLGWSIRGILFSRYLDRVSKQLNAIVQAYKENQP